MTQVPKPPKVPEVVGLIREVTGNVHNQQNPRLQIYPNQSITSDDNIDSRTFIFGPNATLVMFCYYTIRPNSKYTKVTIENSSKWIFPNGEPTAIFHGLSNKAEVAISDNNFIKILEDIAKNPTHIDPQLKRLRDLDQQLKLYQRNKDYGRQIDTHLQIAEIAIKLNLPDLAQQQNLDIERIKKKLPGGVH